MTTRERTSDHNSSPDSPTLASASVSPKSPLPWSAVPVPTWGVDVRAGSRDVCCDLEPEDAAYIVTACNAYPDLASSLTRLQQGIEREASALRDLCAETWRAHRDPMHAEYNDCENNECAWCDETRAHIDLLLTLSQGRATP
jgi:hypothetical protein